MSRRINLDPNKFCFIYDTRGEWHATVIGGNIFDVRGDYVGFVRGENYDVYTASGEWIGTLWHDGRIVRKRSGPRLPMLKELPPTPPKPAKLPGNAPLPPQTGELGFDKIDALDWDPEVFKKLSDLTPDME